MQSGIERDAKTYKDKLVKEQREMKEYLIQSLERKDSVTARFQQRQKSAQQQENREENWRKIQVCKWEENTGM